jgi:hypothetical protein
VVEYTSLFMKSCFGRLVLLNSNAILGIFLYEMCRPRCLNSKVFCHKEQEIN